MKIIDKRPPKLCFAKAGDVVQFVSPENPQGEGPLYLIVSLGEGSPSSRPMASLLAAIKANGLYSDPRTHLAVNLETSSLVELPNLSSRAFIISSASIVIE